ncbi:p53 negative regulator [Trema orientale]|uniref:p53 negative regulator n=1 Tax=Trema orientale TaxID=63057 RepID=A0A2P5FZ34_TREOI|nr:p53 negative regulator [Trema orientale]
MYQLQRTHHKGRSSLDRSKKKQLQQTLHIGRSSVNKSKKKVVKLDGNVTVHLNGLATFLNSDLDEPKQNEKRQKKGGSGLLAPLPLSDALMKFFGTGESTLSRADVVKRMWEYIKQNDLQDPSDKRRVLCDDKLKELFDVDSFHGFSVSKLLTAHFVKTE